MLLELVPSRGKLEPRPTPALSSLSSEQRGSLFRALRLLGAGGSAGIDAAGLMQALCCLEGEERLTEEQLRSVIAGVRAAASSEGAATSLSCEEAAQLLLGGHRGEQQGRYFVALSLAEAETIRCEWLPVEPRGRADPTCIAKPDTRTCRRRHPAPSPGPATGGGLRPLPIAHVHARWWYDVRSVARLPCGAFVPEGLSTQLFSLRGQRDALLAARDWAAAACAAGAASAAPPVLFGTRRVSPPPREAVARNVTRQALHARR
eukprot:scaffold28807_cov67-Phaeocystis_antarctica.AAC.8